jgi:hypothetical protein
VGQLYISAIMKKCNLSPSVLYTRGLDQILLNLCVSEANKVELQQSSLTLSLFFPVSMECVALGPSISCASYGCKTA